MDPDTVLTQPETNTPDPAPDATPEPSTDDAMMEAMGKGVEEVTPEPIPGTNEAAEADANKVPDPDPAADPAAVKDPAEPNKAVEDEITELKLKDRAAERFRTMAKELDGVPAMREAMKAAGIKDAADLPRLAARAKDGDDLVKMVTDTGATADDFSRMLDYFTTITAGRNGDRAAVEKAFEASLAETQAIAKALGREIPGVHDPLAEHADLTAAIESGDMTRKAALEVVQARQLTAAQATQAQATQQRTQQTQAQQQVVAQATAALQAWEAPKLADPAYVALRPALNAKVAEIRQTFPPAQWAAATELAYQALAAAAPKPTPTKPAPGPMRPSGPRPTMQPATFATPEDAMAFGIQEASNG